MSEVFRVEKRTNFTVMANAHLDDPRLSLKAVGLLSKILRLPPDWDYTVRGLAHICKEGKDAIRSAIMELEGAGYIVRKQLHDEGGQFARNEYIVYEEPVDSPLSGFPTTVDAGPLSGFPSTDKPSTDKPSTGNPPQPSTYIPSTEISPPIAPQKAPRQRAAKGAADWKPERFTAFWAYYPRGESKQAAIRAWDKLKPSDELIASMGRALRLQMQSEEWQRGIGIPYAATWINQRRWEDERRLPPEAPDDREEELAVWT